MSLNIESIHDISTFLAFVRVAAKAKFKVSRELVAELIKRCHAFARKHGIQIHFRGVPAQRIVEYVSAGAAIGAVAGLVLGSIPGAMQGAVVGAAIGAAVAHVSITVSFHEGDAATFSIN